MSVAVVASGTTAALAVGGGETTLVTITNPGIYQLVVDVSAMAAGDELEIRIYSKPTAVTDTERLIYFFATANTQDNPLKAMVPMPSPVSYRPTLAVTAGIARAYPWAIWQV